MKRGEGQARTNRDWRARNRVIHVARGRGVAPGAAALLRQREMSCTQHRRSNAREDRTPSLRTGTLATGRDAGSMRAAARRRREARRDFMITGQRGGHFCTEKMTLGVGSNSTPRVLYGLRRAANEAFLSPTAMSRLYVGRLASRTRERDLEDAFGKYGKIRAVDLKYGFAFVVRTEPPW